VKKITSWENGNMMWYGMRGQKKKDNKEKRCKMVVKDKKSPEKNNCTTHQVKLSVISNAIFVINLAFG